MESVTDNMQKYENYREQMRRLNRAMKEGFNLEAVFIEYAILEDRLTAVLRTAGQWNVKEGERPLSIEKKLNLVEKMAEEKESLAHRYFTEELLQQIREWKNQRNGLIHKLMNQSFQHGEVREVAERGEELMKTFKSRAGSFIRATERLEKKKEEAHG